MIFIGFIPAVIGEKAIGQTVRLPMFLDAITASAMIGTAYFWTNALSYIRTIHSDYIINLILNLVNLIYFCLKSSWIFKIFLPDDIFKMAAQ